MIEAPIPADEKERMEAVKKLKLLDTPPQERFDRITFLATRLFDMPISTLTLVDEDREWFLSACGIKERESPRNISFCGHALHVDDILYIPDASKDVRFKDNPNVVGPAHIRFYAGRPLFSADGKRVGVLCVKDTKPRTMTKEQLKLLRDLGYWAELEVNSQTLKTILDNLDLFKQEESRRRELETIFESLPAGLMTIKKSGLIDKCNALMARMLHFEQVKDVLGVDATELFAEKNEWLGRLVHNGLVKGESFRTELDFVVSGGKNGWFRFSGVPIGDASKGLHEGFVLLIEDMKK